ncbi:MAG TPA: histidine phosphatase family protein [Acidobacteriota bacterium]|nr:histidine phosphatase family protein [Acidobacteriota bacterium]
MSVQKGVLRLFLVRHGETAENVHMRYLGKRDEPLNETGMMQADKVAGALSQLPLSCVISSPLRRAADTAVRIREAAGLDLRKDDRLAEGSFGSWEGLTRDEVIGLGKRDADMLSRWEEDPSLAPPGGESIEHIQRRVVSLAEELHREFRGSSVVLVSHVGPVKALLAAVLGIPLRASRHLFLDPGAISVAEWGDRPVLRLFNSHAHLGWTSARWMQ